jgi:hypothetical protein
MPSPRLSPGILLTLFLAMAVILQTGILPGTMWEVAVRAVERFLG